MSSPAASSSSQIVTWMPPLPGVTPIPPRLKSTFGTVATGQLAALMPGFGHFAPANCSEANQAAVYAPTA